MKAILLLRTTVTGTERTILQPEKCALKSATSIGEFSPTICRCTLADLGQ